MAHNFQAATIVDLGLLDYGEAHRLQLALVDAVLGDRVPDHFLVVEHPGTFTLGRRGKRNHLMVDESFLTEKRIPLIHIERGGDITYHGPGQIVLYPILQLRRLGVSVTEYVHALEEVMIRLSASCGVRAGRNDRNRGIWVDDKKLGSVGIAIRRGVTFHGLALNVSLDLTPFSWIDPCGLSGVRMTSLSLESGRQIECAEMKKHLLMVMRAVFPGTFTSISKEQLYDVLRDFNNDG